MDPIRRQLEWLDQQTDSSDPLERWASYYPMIFPALGIMAGIAIQDHFAWPVRVWILSAMVAVFAMIVLCRRYSRQKTHILAVGCSILCLSVGALRLYNFRQPDRADLRRCATDQPVIATLRGRVSTEPFTADKDSWAFGRYGWSQAGSSFYLSVREALASDGMQPMSGKVRVDCGREIQHIHRGDMVEISCRLSRLFGPMNPGQYNLKKNLEDRGIYLSASVKSADALRLLTPTTEGGIDHWLNRLRNVASAALVDDFMLNEPAEAMVSALVLGQTRQIDPVLYEAFRKTGLAHFICLSGMQLAILAGFLWKLGRWFQLGKRQRAFATLLVTILYILIVPPNPATTRAAVICWFFCIAILVRRIPNSRNTLALAAVAMLLFRPTDLFNISWQLSFSTVGGILLFDHAIRHRLLTISIDRWESFARRRSAWTRSILYDWPLAAILMFSMGLAAWLGGSGIMLCHFGTITPLASLFTVLVNPLVLGVTLAGFIKLIIAAWLPTLSTLLGMAAILLAEWMNAIVRLLSEAPFCQISTGKLATGWIALFYAALLTAWFAPRRNRFVRPIRYAMVLVAAIAVVSGSAFFFDRNNLKLTCLAVGHGQAIVLTLPEGTTWMIDAGSSTSPNIGRRIILPYLQHRGIDRLAGVILSHADIDHFNGLPEVSAVIPTERILANRAFLDRARTLSGAGLLRQILEIQGYNIDDIYISELPGDPVRLTRLWPDEVSLGQSFLGDNDKSEVLRIDYAGRTILICSDIEEAAQSALMSKYPNLKADVLILPHHGSTTSPPDKLLTHLGASTVVASCASSKVPTAWKPTDPSVTAWYTGSDGAVTLTIKTDGTFHTTGFAQSIDP